MGSKRKKQFRKNKTREIKQTKLISGTLSVARAGFGFVKPETGGDEIFVPQRYIGEAIDGDTVKVEFLRENRSRGQFKTPGAKIVSITDRKRKTIVGELLAGKKVRPLARSLTEDFFLRGDLGDAEKGDWIRINMPEPGKKGGKALSGTLESVIGKVGCIKDDLMAISTEYGLQPRYTLEEEEKALKIKSLDLEREDLTHLFIATIDPIDAKDYDDAISLELPGTTATLGVHIADVSAFIRPYDEFDRKAFSRSFTTYMPGMTLPMLPRNFTRLASLNQGATSFASTIFINFDRDTGEVKESRRCRSVITVRARLTFDEVQSFIDGTTPGSWSEDTKTNLGHVVQLTRKMREFRKKTEHYLELATTSARVVFDKSETEIIGMRVENQREAEQLVEDCMLAANVEVAKELSQKSVPGLFRVHPQPNEAKLFEFSEFLDTTFNISTGDLSSRRACNKFLESLPDDHYKSIITDAFLRSLPRAYYLETPSEHFGLGKGLYSHFTSPIRRYPDLAVHQQLLCLDLKKGLRSKGDFAKLAADCSAKEENNDQAYFAANDRMKLHYLKKIINDGRTESYEGIIQKVSTAGLVVNIPEIGIGGFVPVEKLSGESYTKDAGKLSAQTGHRKFKCGDFIYLAVERIDMVRGSAIFRPV